MPFTKGQPGGPGRRPKAQKFARPIARAEKQIVDCLPELIDLHLELARGVWVEDTGRDGTPRIYKRAPDRDAGQYLINRILGKPTERAEVTGANGGPIELKPIDYRAGLDALKPDDADA